MKKKENKVLENTKKLALSGIFTALCFAVMYVGGITQVFDLCAAVIAALVVIISVIEIGGMWPWLIWGVASVLCLFFIPDKFIALEFILFGGLYPMVKAWLEKFPAFIAWSMKILYFNVVFSAAYLLATYLFGMRELGFTLKIPAYVAANGFFILADVCFTLIISVYFTKLRPRIKKSSN
ncbi:MAG: hypothetical protein E7660_00360 [Ruminococcaceae bacterium]|nr:hypothetical protein [Oscillospiraceae bacterium]